MIMLMRLSPELAINPDDIVSLRQEHRDYMNGSDNFLIVKMRDGTEHRLKHGYGVDIFKLEKEIMGHKQGEWF
jgi:hypothetical protein